MDEPAFPTKVRIGYRTYRVEDWEPKAARAAHRYGEASHLEGIIRVSRDNGPVQSAETLLHELIHGVAEVGHSDLFGDEERAVAGLSAGLAQVMRDNPAVRGWLDWAWQQED